MLKISELGRTMLETISVLAIVGVLSVGGFGIIGKAMQTHREAQLLSDTADLARYAKKFACKYEKAYRTYTLFLYKANAYPTNLYYDSGSNTYVGIMDSIYQINGDNDYFNINISNLSDDSCIKLATADWGTGRTSGMIGVAIGNSDVGSYFKSCTSDCADKDFAVSSLSSNYPMSVDKAVENCTNGSNNTIQLWYKGCK